jgi:hypothetical protein
MSALEFREATARTAKFTSKTSLRKATFQCAKVIQGEEINFDEVEYMTVGNVGTLLNLLPSTTYKFRTYTEEQGALKYSNEVIFTTAGEQNCLLVCFWGSINSNLIIYTIKKLLILQAFLNAMAIEKHFSISL